jgi:hypothetical protein
MRCGVTRASQRKATSPDSTGRRAGSTRGPSRRSTCPGGSCSSTSGRIPASTGSSSFFGRSSPYLSTKNGVSFCVSSSNANSSGTKKVRWKGAPSSSGVLRAAPASEKGLPSGKPSGDARKPGRTTTHTGAPIPQSSTPPHVQVRRGSTVRVRQRAVYAMNAPMANRDRASRPRRTFMRAARARVAYRSPTRGRTGR